MKVFISWARDTSRQYAKAVAQWLGDTLQTVDPYFTEEAITSGTAWRQDVRKNLEASNFGLACMTSDNLTAPWLLFEAGALSKLVEPAKVCCLLFGVEPEDLPEPLSMFQARHFSKENMLAVARDINAAHAERVLSDALVERAFKRTWPDLDKAAAAVEPAPATSPPEAVSPEMKMLRRIYGEVSAQGSRLSEAASQFSNRDIVNMIESLRRAIEAGAGREGVYVDYGTFPTGPAEVYTRPSATVLRFDPNAVRVGGGAQPAEAGAPPTGEREEPGRGRHK